MSWARMRFRDQLVWVRVDDSGKMKLDGDGRAEMKYRVEDSRVYRPATGNLLPAPPEAAASVPDRPGDDAPPPPPPATSQKARPGARKSAPARTPALPGPVAADTIHVWTDGACTGNPGPMGLGVVVIADGTHHERGEYLGIGTNNIAELTAIERGLDIAAELDPQHARPVRVYTDSAYSIGVVSQGWKAKANVELVASLRAQIKDFPNIAFVKVAGHAGVPENERCDELARNAITSR